MKVKKYNSDKLVLVNTKKYKIDWDKPGASKPESTFKELIRPYWEKSHIVLEQYRVPGTLWRLDFFNIFKSLVIEISPESHHGNYNKFFHKNRIGFLKSIKSDYFKYNWCVSNNIKMLVLTDLDLDNFSPKYILEKFNIDIL